MCIRSPLVRPHLYFISLFKNPANNMPRFIGT
jgi:hypothetical protein